MQQKIIDFRVKQKNDLCLACGSKLFEIKAICSHCGFNPGCCGLI